MTVQNIISALLLGAGLSMDAFAVSVCKGLAVGRVRARHLLAAGLWFGGFQALMTLLGFLLGASFHAYIDAFDHWIAFALLALIGANMLKEAFSKKEEPKPADASFGVRTMLLMAVATSIDAMAAGVALAMENGADIRLTAPLVGAITFAFSAAGVKLGSVFGERYEKKARIAGGVILLLIALKALLQR